MSNNIGSGSSSDSPARQQVLRSRQAGPPDPASCSPHCSGDPVNSPVHYTAGGIECIDYLRNKLGAAGFEGFLRGNVIKYLTRYDQKGGVEDIRKARRYLDWLIQHLETEAPLRSDEREQ